MRKTLTLQGNAGIGAVTTVPCQPGQRIKILSVVMSTTGLAADGFFVCQFTRGADVIMNATSNMLPAGCFLMNWAVAFGQSTSVMSMIDPVTGVVTLNTTQTQATSPLPEIWWEWDITLTVAGAPTTSLLIVYELDDGLSATAGQGARKR